jgi:protein-S-isoprenylcysteine O-methyltransferase Ste14
MTALVISALLGIVLTVGSLYVKAELERRFNRRRKIPLLHAVNVLVISAVIASSYYMFSDRNLSIDSKRLFYVYFGAMQLLLPIYALICLLFSKREKKYTRSADKKVLYIKEKYLAPRRRDDDYHSKTS